MKKWIPILILTAFLASICPAALAEEKKPPESPWEKFSVSLGVFLNETDSNIRLGVPGVGVSIDLEEALGLDSTSEVFRLEGAWRFTKNRRHRADLSWFSLDRGSTLQIGQDIVIDGVTYPTGTTATTHFNLDIYKAAYSYSFFQDDRMDIALSAGLFIMPVSFEFNATGLLTGRASESITAPLPVFGLRADFAITPKWFIKSSTEFFYLEYDNFKGAIVDTRVAAEYKAFKHFGVGLALENFMVQVEAEKNVYPEIDLVGKIGIQYMGALLYGKFYF